MYWEYRNPTAKVFVADGKRSYFYVPQDRHVIVSELDTTKSGNPLLFLLGQGELERDFTVERENALGGQTLGNVLLRLSPKQPSAEFASVVIEVDPDQSYAIRRLIVFEHVGNQNEYIFTHVLENIPIPDRRFEFKVPAGTKVIQANG